MAEKFCPNCGSKNIFVFNVGLKCGDCGLTAQTFPEIEKIKDKKENEK